MRFSHYLFVIKYPVAIVSRVPYISHHETRHDGPGPGLLKIQALPITACGGNPLYRNGAIECPLDLATRRAPIVSDARSTAKFPSADSKAEVAGYARRNRLLPIL